MRAFAPTISPSPRTLFTEHGVPYREGEIVRGGSTVVATVPAGEVGRWATDALRAGKTSMEQVFGDHGGHEARIATTAPLETAMELHAEVIHEAGCHQQWAEVVGIASHALIWTDDPSHLADAVEAVRRIDPGAEVTVSGSIP